MAKFIYALVLALYSVPHKHLGQWCFSLPLMLAHTSHSLFPPLHTSITARLEVDANTALFHQR